MTSCTWHFTICRGSSWCLSTMKLCARRRTIPSLTCPSTNLKQPPSINLPPRLIKSAKDSIKEELLLHRVAAAFRNTEHIKRRLPHCTFNCSGSSSDFFRVQKRPKPAYKASSVSSVRLFSAFSWIAGCRTLMIRSGAYSARCLASHRRQRSKRSKTI